MINPEYTTPTKIYNILINMVKSIFIPIEIDGILWYVLARNRQSGNRDA